MVRQIIALLCALAFLSACAIPEDSAQLAATYGTPKTGPGSLESISPPQDPKPKPAPPPEQFGVGVPLSKIDQSIFKDPSYQRAFAESYLAETDIEPAVKPEDRILLGEVLALLTEKKKVEAAALLEAKINTVSSGSLDYTLGNIYQELEETDQAIVAYTNAVQKFPKFRRAWLALAELAIKAKRNEDAIIAFGKVVELGGANAPAYGLLGVAHSRVGNLLSAESAFRMATLMAPGVRDWQLYLADTLFRQERFSEAAALFGQLIKEKPDDAKLWLAQGQAFASMAQYTRAAENFEIADRLGGANGVTLLNLGNIYAKEKLNGLAVNAYVRALARSPQLDPARLVTAARYMAEGGASDDAIVLTEAIEAMAGARLSNAQKVELAQVRIRHAVATGDGAAEVQQLEHIVDLNPRDGNALILLGKHHLKAKRFDEALGYFARAQEFEAWEMAACLGQSQSFVAQQKYQEALRFARRAYEVDDRDSTRRYLDQIERLAKQQSASGATKAGSLP